MLILMHQRYLDLAVCLQPKATSSQLTEHAQNSATTQQDNHQGYTPHAPQHSEHQINNQGLSPHEKWLQELAAQVEEQKAK